MMASLRASDRINARIRGPSAEGPPSGMPARAKGGRKGKRRTRPRASLERRPAASAGPFIGRIPDFGPGIVALLDLRRFLGLGGAELHERPLRL